jgi:hypothetical protein
MQVGIDKEVRADKVDPVTGGSLRDALSERPAKRAVKGSSLDGALRPLP